MTHRAPRALPAFDLRGGWASVRHEFGLWARYHLAAGIIYVLLSAVIVLVDRPGQTQAQTAGQHEFGTGGRA